MNRDNLRRQSNRRTRERRTLAFVFNSPEWLASVQREYSLWPKEDRRSGDRRECERRNIDRRSEHRANFKAVAPFRHDISAVSLLDDEEKAMIASLFGKEDTAD